MLKSFDNNFGFSKIFIVKFFIISLDLKLRP